MKIKNVKLLIGTLALLGLIVHGYHVLAQSNYVQVTQGGNSGNPLSKFQLAPKGKDSDNVDKKLSEEDFNALFFGPDDTTVPTHTRNFRLYGSSVFDNLVVTDKAYFNGYVSIGYDTPPTFAEGDARLNVNGNILIQELRHPDCVDTASCLAIPDERLCANDYGILQRCNI